MVIRSYGSWTSPSTSRRRTSGRDAVSSKPSRRICSMRTASWSSPRPRTSNASLDSAGRTSIETLPRTSFSSRALIWRLVTYLPSRPGERRGVDPERHAQRRRVDVEARQRARIGGIGERVADRHLGQAGDADDVAGAGLLDVDAVDAVRGLEAGHGAGQGHRPARLDGARRVVGLLADDRDPLAGPDRPVPDPPDRHPADVLVGRQVGDQQLERMAGRVGHRRRDLDEQVEQRPQVRPGLRRGRGSPCRPWRWCRRSGTRSGGRRRRGP